MPTLVQFDFPLQGPWGDETAAAYRELAELIATTPGLRWKAWTENSETGEGGGVHLFDEGASAAAYVAEHTSRLEGFRVIGIRAKSFHVNEPLTAITRGPLDA